MHYDKPQKHCFMKRLFVMVAFFATLSNPILADDNDKKPVILDVFGTGDNSERDEIPRAPIRRPSLFIKDHTLSFTNSCVGYTLQLIQDDAVVYTYYIESTDDLVLSSDLTGFYEVHLVGGSFTFVGEIEL